MTRAQRYLFQAENRRVGKREGIRRERATSCRVVLGPGWTAVPALLGRPGLDRLDPWRAAEPFAGADRFHTFSGSGVDRVMDFNLAEGDRVMLDPGTTYTISQVGADTVIGIVETMKLMNSVPAGVAGVVAEFCVANAEFAAQGAALLRIRADQ